MKNHLLSKDDIPRCALITGGSRGLGLAFAHACARRGMDLMLVALPDSGLAQAAQELRAAYGVRCETLAQDLAVPGGPEAAAQWAANLDWPLAYLVNNAGVSYNSRFEDSTLDDIEAVILVNTLATVKLTHLLLPVLKQRERAYVLNVASLAAFFPMPYMPVYAPSKAFLLGFSLALRQEMRGTPVSVSVLCPNGLRTRADCRDKIEQHGAIGRIFCMDAAPAAEYAVRQTLSGAAIIVPGLLNRSLAAMSRLVPRTTILAVVSAFWGKTARPSGARPVGRVSPPTRSPPWSAGAWGLACGEERGTFDSRLGALREL
jgi:short-subunit dehydrogenase